jgi:3-oxoacyl-[acyl-carrier-protein] synthase II
MTNQTQDVRRVVVTGIGAVTPLGLTASETWEGVLKNRCGIDTISAFDHTDFRVHLAAEVKNFDPTQYMEKKEARRMDRYCQFSVAAAQEAIADAGLTVDTYGADQVGAIVASGIGGLITFQDEVLKLGARGPRAVSPLFIPMMIGNMAAGFIAMHHGFKGDNMCLITACASGTHAIGEGFRKIKHGYLDACIVGGAEAAIAPTAVAGFSNMTALSKETDPACGSRPFDAERDGFVLGEGGAILVLESLEGALARGARIYGEVTGYGATADGYHITSPDPEGEGACKAMKNAMAEAGIAPEQVDYINAHGTSTPLNDKYETIAIKKAMGEEAARNVPITSTKSNLGHLLGAAGAIEAILTLKIIGSGVIPQTIGFATADPECDLDYVTDANRTAAIRYALSNSLGFGGQNGTLCLAKFEEA